MPAKASLLRVTVASAVVAATLAGTLGAQRGAVTTDPLLTLETAKGTIEMRLFRAESPKSVEQIIALVKRNFYRGQRIHRVERSLVQFGDPSSRDVSRKDWWGRTGSGNRIGVAEFNKHLNVRGAVGLAHGGNAQNADSQIYILKAAMPNLDKKHVVIGQVTKGLEVADKLAVADVIKNVTITEASPK
jgi:peptidyl-prolyl cis-trans isomerase B (cyclophilin B)